MCRIHMNSTSTSITKIRLWIQIQAPLQSNQCKKYKYKLLPKKIKMFSKSKISCLISVLVDTNINLIHDA